MSLFIFFDTNLISNIKEIDSYGQVKIPKMCTLMIEPSSTHKLPTS